MSAMQPHGKIRRAIRAVSLNAFVNAAVGGAGAALWPTYRASRDLLYRDDTAQGGSS